MQDAQEIQFLKANEAIRNDRARLEADLRAQPALNGVPAPALSPLLQDTHLANAILVRLEPWADPRKEYFPRRVAILPFDQGVLLAIVVSICVVASLLGIRRALHVDPTTALGGGA